MHRKVALQISTLLVGVCIGVGAVAVADQEPPRAKTSATEADIVKQLRDANRSLRLLLKTTGGYTLIAPSGGSVIEHLRNIDRNIERLGRK